MQVEAVEIELGTLSEDPLRTALARINVLNQARE